MKKQDHISRNFMAGLSIPTFGLMAVFLIMAVIFSACSHKKPEATVPVTSGAGDDSQAKIKESFGRLPLYFIENRGQTDPKVAYYIKGKEKTLFFTRDGITFALKGEKETAAKKEDRLKARKTEKSNSDKKRIKDLERWVVKLDFIGANPNVKPEVSLRIRRRRRLWYKRRQQRRSLVKKRKAGFIATYMCRGRPMCLPFNRNLSTHINAER